MAKIIAFMNSKGGVSKTTSTLNIGAFLARMGKNTLLIDADAQANLTHILCGRMEYSRTLLDSLLHDEELPIINVAEGISIVPSSIGLAMVDSSILKGHTILDKRLATIRARYDYILIDCPPALNVITYNAIFTSDFVLVPMLGENLSMEGLETIENIISRLNVRTHGGNAIGGIFFARFKENRGMDKIVRKRVMAKYGDKVMNTFIHECVSLGEATIAHKSIFDYKPRSKGAQDYENLTKEIISKL